MPLLILWMHQLFKWLQQDQTCNHLVRKRTVNQLVKLAGLSKWLSGCLQTKWLCVRIPLHLNFRYHACFGQGVSWRSANYRAWIRSETWTWHDKNMQPSPICFYSAVLIFQLLTIIFSQVFFLISSAIYFSFQLIVFFSKNFTLFVASNILFIIVFMFYFFPFFHLSGVYGHKWY